MNDHYIEEELTLFEFSEKFLLNNDMSTPTEIDISSMDIQVETLNREGESCFKRINKFFIKQPVERYYTDGKISVSFNHRFVVDGIEKFPHELPEFKLVEGHMNVADIEVDDLHTYLANGHLNHNTTTGGMAIPFAAGIRLRLQEIGKLKDSEGTIIGTQVKATVVKNRFGPPRRSVVFNIHYESGIDNYGSWLTTLKEFGFLKQSGSQYSYTYIDGDTGEEITKKFQSKQWNKMLREDEVLRETIYQQIADAYIMKYKNQQELGIDDLEVGEADEEE